MGLKTIFLIGGVLASCVSAGWAQQRVFRRIAFGSCANQDKEQPIWGAVLKEQPDLFIFLGDNIYADTTHPSVMKKAYDRFAERAPLEQLRRSAEIMATWDDHDYGQDDGGADYPMKKESQRLFLDFFQEPADSPRRTQQGVYTARIFGPVGKRVQVILLDTRTFRTPLRFISKPGERPVQYGPDETPTSTLLGSAQWQWLMAQLQMPAEIRLIGSSIEVIADEHGYEKWANFPGERARLLALLRAAGGVSVILSGDRHFAELSVLEEIGFPPLYDLTSSSLTHTKRGAARSEPNHHRVAAYDADNNFGLLILKWEATPPQIDLQIRNESGALVLIRSIPALAPTTTSEAR